MTGNRAGDERIGVIETLGSMAAIQVQTAAVSRQMGQLAMHMAESERQRAAEKNEAAIRKGREAAEWNLHMTSLLAVPRVLEWRPGTTGAVSRPCEDKQQHDLSSNAYRVENPIGNEFLFCRRPKSP